MMNQIEIKSFYRSIFQFFKKTLSEFFEDEKDFKVISIQINELGEYSVKVFFTLRKRQELLLKFEKEFVVLFKEVDTQSNYLKVKANIRLKDLELIEDLLIKTNN